MTAGRPPQPGTTSFSSTRRRTATTASSDKIDLHLIDADAKAGDQAFRFVTHFTRPAAGQSHGEVMVVPSGPDQKVEIDFDGNRSVDSVILVHHVGALHGYDFVL